MRYPCSVMMALYFKDGHLQEKEIDKPRIGRGEALVKVKYAGICSTDLEILKGYMDFSGIPGHEFVGTVETPRSLAGRRVTGEINSACGKCDLCKRGLGKHCRDRTVLGISGRNGAFAEYLTLPMANLHAVPDDVSDEEAVFTELARHPDALPPAVRARAERDGLRRAVADYVAGMTDRFALEEYAKLYDPFERV